MKISSSKYALLIRKTATIMLLTASVAAFATLGDGTKRDTTHHKSLLLMRAPVPNYKNFTLRSGYTYRGSSVISNAPEHKYYFLDRVITYQKGNQTYILPMKKKVLLEKVAFNPYQR